MTFRFPFRWPQVNEAATDFDREMLLEERDRALEDHLGNLPAAAAGGAIPYATVEVGGPADTPFPGLLPTGTSELRFRPHVVVTPPYVAADDISWFVCQSTDGAFHTGINLTLYRNPADLTAVTVGTVTMRIVDNGPDVEVVVPFEFTAGADRHDIHASTLHHDGQWRLEVKVDHDAPDGLALDDQARQVAWSYALAWAPPPPPT